MNDAVILDRAVRLANVQMKTVALQRRRIRAVEPEDVYFALRWWADMQFFILSLNRLGTCANIACNVSDTKIRQSVLRAINKFYKALPKLKMLRDIGEHHNEYAVDNPKRPVKTVDRKQLEVVSWDGTVY
jgi:hypothetical protein